MEYVNALSRMVETPAWLAEHKKPDVFVDRAVFSEHDDAQSILWNYVSSRFEAYDPPPMPLGFYRDQIPKSFTQEQYDEAYERVRQYNRTIGTALRLRRQEEEAEKKGELAELLADRADGEVGDRVIKTAIQDLAGWSEGITEDRESWACALWHAAHNAAIASQDRRMSRYQEAAQRARAQGKPPPREPAYATASAAFHAFQKEVTDFLEQVERQPATEVTITGVQHHLTREEMDGFNEEGRVVQIEIALETPELETRTGGTKVPEQRLVVYRLEDGEKRWMGVVPRGNAGNIEPGRYQTHLKRRLRKKIKEGQSPYMNSLRGTLVPAKETR
jgi:hypothetical protein